MNTEQLEAIKGEFPNAISIPELFDKVNALIKDKGYENSQVKPAIALCRDDSVKEMHSTFKKKGYLDPFSMDALSGMPVFGETSVGAFYHHIPDSGMGLIIYGPHIGLSNDGIYGLLKRAGIKDHGKSCGANHALLGKWEKGDFGPYNHDRELSDVSSLVEHEKDTILKSENKLLTLTRIEYKEGLNKISEMISKIQKSEHHQYPILLVSGIHIDTNPEISNYFDVKEVGIFENGNYNFIK